VASLNSKHRAPLAADIESDDGQQFDTDRDRFAIEIRDLDGGTGQRLRRWVHDRLVRQLAKFAPQIERVDVRLGDVHGPKGGVDRSCMVHVILSGLPPVIAEAVGETHQHAFDQAAGRAARATGHNLARHGFSTGHKRRSRPPTRPTPDQQAAALDSLASENGDQEPLFGKRAGHGRDQLMLLQQRPEKVRRDIPVDTSKPGTSASDRKAGYGHTGKRNTKLNNAGMTYALEDSTSARPSRKSSRRSSNRSKPDNGLTLRTKSAVSSSKSNAARSAGRRH
jgi:hypothetical protein